MSLQGFDKAYYLSEKLTELQALPGSTWGGKTAHDVELAIVNAGQTAESNYINYGYKEGLNPNSLFNQTEYINAKAAQLVATQPLVYTTVAVAKTAFLAALGGSDPYQHYLTNGAAEGINPSSAFDSSAYLTAKLASLQADPSQTVAWSGKTTAQLLTFLLSVGQTPLTNYLQYGINENLGYTPATGLFTLTQLPDVHTANVFYGPQVENTGGTDLINSFQNSDVLTGIGVNPTLTVDIGNPNDNGNTTIAGHLRSIQTFNADFTATVGMTIDLQDSEPINSTILTQSLQNVNVTRVDAGGSYIKNLHARATNLSVTDSQALSNVSFTYLDQELAGAADNVTLTLNKANIHQLTLGSEIPQNNEIETVNLVVNAGGASSANHVDLRHAIGSGAAGQTLKIQANDTLRLGFDVNGNGNTIEHNNAFGTGVVSTVTTPDVTTYTYGTGANSGQIISTSTVKGTTTTSEAFAPMTDGIKEIDITGSGNVTLASVGSHSAFLLDGHTSTGNIAVNISNAADQYTGSYATRNFMTGAGNDTVLIKDLNTDNRQVSTITFAGNLDTGAGNDAVTGNDLAAGTVLSHFVGAVITTDDGNDTVTVNTLRGSNGVPLTFDYAGAYINVGDGDNVVTAKNLQTEARIVAGSGNDTVDLSTTVNADTHRGYQIIAGDDGRVLADGQGAEVWLGAGDDKLNITLTGTGLYNFSGRIALIEGYVDGGSGSDTITVTGNKSALGSGSLNPNTNDGELDVVHGSTTHTDPVTGLEVDHTNAVTGVETLTLNSTTAYDSLKVTDFSLGGSGVNSITANDNNQFTADYHVDRGQFDSALATINLNHQDGVIRNTIQEGANWVAFSGSTTIDTLVNLTGTEQINITALEAQTNGSDQYHTQTAGTGTAAAADPLGTVYGPGTVGSTDGLSVAFTPDIIVELDAAPVGGAWDESTPDALIHHHPYAGVDVAHVTLNDAVTPNTPYGPDIIKIYNYDVSIVDLKGVTALDGYLAGSSVPSANQIPNLYESLALTVNRNADHGVNLNGDTGSFTTALTVTGDGTGGGNLTLINVDAATIDTTGYKGNVYIGVQSSWDHHITTGIGNDIVRLGDSWTRVLGNDYVNLGSGNDTVIFNGLGSGSVNNAGLTVGDTVIGGQGYDTLAIAGATSYDTYPNAFGVTLGESEFYNVTGFERIQLSVGQGVDYQAPTPFAAPPSAPLAYTLVGPINYHLTLTDHLFVNNGVLTGNPINVNEKVIDVLNDNIPLGVELAPIHESDTTLDLTALSAENQIRYDGAVGVGLIDNTFRDGQPIQGIINSENTGSGTYTTVTSHGSDDRFIFSDKSLDGGDTIDGGATFGDGTNTGIASFYDVRPNIQNWHRASLYDHTGTGIGTGLGTGLTEFFDNGVGNGDVLEVRNSAVVTASVDLAHISNVGTIAFNNDKGTAQTLRLDLTDKVVDAMVNSLHSATSGSPEELFIVANDHTMRANENTLTPQVAAAQLNLDLHTLTAQSQVFIQLDDQEYPTVQDALPGHTTGNHFGTDYILGGEGSIYVNGVTSNDVIDAGSGGGSIGFTTDFIDHLGDNQIQNIEHIDVWTDVNGYNHYVYDPTANSGAGAYVGTSDALYVDLSHQQDRFTINVTPHDGYGVYGWQSGDGLFLATSGGNGYDNLLLNQYIDGGDTVYGSQGGDVIYVYDSHATIYGGSGNNIIHIEGGTLNAAHTVLTDTRDHDISWGSATNDFIYAGDGSDTVIDFGTGGNTIWTAGYDSLNNSSRGVDTVTVSTNGNDIVVLNGTGTGAQHTVEIDYAQPNKDAIYLFTAGSSADHHDVIKFVGTSDLGGLNINASLLQHADTTSANVLAGAGFVTVANAYTGALATTANIVSALTFTHSLTLDTTGAFDVLYVAVDNGFNTVIAKVHDTSTNHGTIDAAEVTIVATLVGVGDAATLVHANLTQFA